MSARGLATAKRRRALAMIRPVFDYAIRDRRRSVMSRGWCRCRAEGPSGSRTGHDPNLGGEDGGTPAHR